MFSVYRGSSSSRPLICAVTTQPAPNSTPAARVTTSRTDGTRPRPRRCNPRTSGLSRKLRKIPRAKGIKTVCAQYRPVTTTTVTTVAVSTITARCQSGICPVFVMGYSRESMDYQSSCGNELTRVQMKCHGAEIHSVSTQVRLETRDLSPGGATWYSQGSAPGPPTSLSDEPRRGGMNAPESSCRPSGALRGHRFRVQGLTPLAIPCRPYGAEILIST